jgi:hypothetical protein
MEGNVRTIVSYSLDERLGELANGLSVLEGYIVGPATEALNLIRQVVVGQP